MAKNIFLILILVGGLFIAYLIFAPKSGVPEEPAQLFGVAIGNIISTIFPSASLFQEDKNLNADRLKFLAPSHQAVNRSKFVKFKVDNFKKTSRGKTQIKSNLSFNLFPDVNLEAVVEKSEDLAENKIFGKGYIKNNPGSLVTLLFKNNRMLGHIYMPNNKIYEIRPVENDTYVLAEINASFFRDDPPARRNVRALSPSSMSQIESTVMKKIDVMVFYTDDAKSLTTGEQNIKDRIDLAIAEANLAYENSNIYQRLNLLYSGEVNYDESGTFSTDLDRLTDPDDGYLDEAHALRDQYGADYVSLIISDAADWCGISNPMDGENYTNYAPLAFSVVELGCLPNYTLAHELGHGMGAQHDYARTGGEYQGLYYYSYGYQDPEEFFRTIMAYDCPRECPRRPFFSNPRVNFNNKPTGIADEADNARTLNNTRYIASNLRQSLSDMPIISVIRTGLEKSKATNIGNEAAAVEYNMVITDSLKEFTPFASSMSNWQFIQTFKAPRNKIKGISFAMRKKGDPFFLPLMAIKTDDELNPSTLGYVAIDKTIVPSDSGSNKEIEWVRVDFRDPLTVERNRTYKLVFFVNNNSSSDYYLLGVGKNNYSGGALAIKNGPTAKNLQISDLMVKIYW